MTKDINIKIENKAKAITTYLNSNNIDERILFEVHIFTYLDLLNKRKSDYKKHKTQKIEALTLELEVINKLEAYTPKNIGKTYKNIILDHILREYTYALNKSNSFVISRKTINSARKLATT